MATDLRMRGLYVSVGATDLQKLGEIVINNCLQVSTKAGFKLSSFLFFIYFCYSINS